MSTDSMEGVSEAVREVGVLLEYVGPRQGEFDVVGAVSRLRYHVPGRYQVVEFDGRPGVNPVDLRWFLAVNRGRAYQLYEEPEPEPEPEEPEPEPEPEDEPDGD